MALIAFVKNYEDLSTDRGYQFKFHCDKCGNGYMSRFQASTAGMVGSALRAAGDLFGGFLGSAGNSAFEVQRMVGGSGHDAAIEEAIAEGKANFHQCGRCGRWVCPQVCWNAQVGQCDECAPKFEQEYAAHHAQAKAQAARAQLFEKAGKTDYVADANMAANAYAPAPPPQAFPGPGYPQMQGAPGVPPPALQAGPGYPQQPPAFQAPQLPAQTGAPEPCGACGYNTMGAKFCPNCGTPKAKPGCPKCGHALIAGTKFCGECGAKTA